MNQRPFPRLPDVGKLLMDLGEGIFEECAFEESLLRGEEIGKIRPMTGVRSPG